MSLVIPQTQPNPEQPSMRSTKPQRDSGQLATCLSKYRDFSAPFLHRPARRFDPRTQVNRLVRNPMHFREFRAPEKGNSSYLHEIFPMGGPQ